MHVPNTKWEDNKELILSYFKRNTRLEKNAYSREIKKVSLTTMSMILFLKK